MSDLTLTNIHLRNGLWEGHISGAADTGERPDIRVTYQDQPVDSVALQEGDGVGAWTLTIPVPIHAVADGVHSFLIFDGATDTKLGDFTLLAGEAMADDIRAEMELLRAELDMLKRAFRRHCLETM
jgi:hypothetical protein